MKATRQKKHLMRCPSAPDSLKDKLKEAEDGSAPAQKRIKLGPLTGGGRAPKAEGEAIDKALISFVASAGISFNVVNSPFFTDLMPSLRSKCVMPARHRLAVTLLDSAYEDAKAKVDAAVEKAGELRSEALSFDGWKSVTDNHVVNALLKIGKDSFFIDSAAAGHESADAASRARLLLKAVDDLGGQKAACGASSGNTQACVSAKELAIQKRPSMLALQGAPHAADLLAKDLCSHGSMKQCLDHCNLIRSGARCSQYLLSLHRKVKDNFNKQAKLNSAPAAVEIPTFPKTRLAYAPLVMRQVLRSKQALRQLVESGDFDEAARSARSRAPGREKVKNMIDTVEGGALWKMLAHMASLGEALSEFAHGFEREVAKIGPARRRSAHISLKAEEFARSCNGLISDAELSHIKARSKQRCFGPADQAVKICVVTDAHYLARMLNPWEAPIAMHEDHRARIERALSKCGSAESQVMEIAMEIGNSLTRSGAFAAAPRRNLSLTNQEDPLPWWAAHGGSSSIFDLARRVSLLSPTGCNTERSFSAQSLLHAKVRNRLSHERVKKLLFAQWNLRLLRNVTTDIFEDLVDGVVTAETEEEG